MKNKVNFQNIIKQISNQSIRINRYIRAKDIIVPELEAIFIKNSELLIEIIKLSEKYKKESEKK